jgi:hypothetical protein
VQLNDGHVMHNIDAAEARIWAELSLKCLCNVYRTGGFGLPLLPMEITGKRSIINAPAQHCDHADGRCVTENGCLC